MAFGFPAPRGMAPIILDMATSQAARGKIRLAQTNEENIPLGWAMDAQGQQTQDPAAALAGSMLPVGGAKGYGLSVMVDIMAGLMTRSASGGAARNLNNSDGPSRCGHTLIAIDIPQMLPREDYDAGMLELAAATKAAGPAGAVVLPGERGADFMRGRNGRIPLSEAIIKKLDSLAQQAQVVALERD
jgi:L-2-hydroxycarboxylate dehydrogenase (NAD+)